MDEYQFGVFVAENMPFLKLRALRLVYNVEDAEDLVQDAILRSFRNREKLREGAKGYLCASLRSAYFDFVRSKKRRETCGLEYERADSRCALSSDERVELSELLDQEINRLSPRARQVVRDYAADFSYSEMASRAKVCEGTVKSTLNRARKILQENLTRILGAYPA